MPDNNTPIQIVNEDGKLIGVDSETGDTIPIEFGAIASDQLRVDESRTESQTVSISVPSEFETVSDAIDEIREIRVPPGVAFEIIVESGHEWQEQVDVIGEDMSHVTITSEEATVTVESGYSSWIVNVESYANGPVWDLLLDEQEQGNVERCYRVRRGSTGFIAPDAGFQNFTEGYAIDCRYGCLFTAEDAIATGCRRGVSIGQASFGVIDGSDLSDSTQYGIRTTHCVLVGGSVDLTNCWQAFNIDDASLVRLNDASISGGEDFPVIDEGSIAHLRGSEIADVEETGLVINRGSRAILRNIKSQNNDRSGIEAVNGSEAVIIDAKIENNGNYGVRASQGSRVTVTNSDVVENDTDIQCEVGSIITVYNSSTTESTDSNPHESDVNIEPNSIAGNGIIFMPVIESS